MPRDVLSYVALTYDVVERLAGVASWHDLCQEPRRALEAVLKRSWHVEFGCWHSESRLFRRHHHEEER